MNHTPLPPNMSLVNVGLGQLQWWMWDSDEYKDGIRKGHFVGAAFKPPYRDFIMNACNSHDELIEKAENLIEQLYSLGINADPAPDIQPLISAIRKAKGE